MITKVVAFIAAALGLFLNAFGQVAPDYRSQVAGAVQVVSVTFDPVQQNVPYQVVLRNISPRIILAYEYTVHFHYANGEVRSTGGGKDAVIVFVEGPKAASLFRPNATETISASTGFSPSVHAALKSVDVDITAAVLDDNTLLGDPAAIADYAASRAREMQMVATVLADLKDVKSSQSPRQRALDLAAKARQENPNFQGRVVTLTMLSTRIDALDEIISEYEALVSGLEAHSKLTAAK